MIKEPKVMIELHKIREEMSKMTKKEFYKDLKKTSKEFKNLVMKYKKSAS